MSFSLLGELILLFLASEMIAIFERNHIQIATKHVRKVVGISIIDPKSNFIDTHSCTQ